MTRPHVPFRPLVIVALGGAALMSGCAPKAPPPPPPPPPPPIAVVVPPKPTPPNGASPDLVIPPADATGLRISVNRNISPAQMVWNLRSAYNVAALNCRAPEHAEIVPNYRAFLQAQTKGLAKANKTIDSEFRQRHGTAFIAPRESYMTEVYNHFALPPTMPEFCSAVLAVSRDGAGIKPAELEAFAMRSLPAIEVVFDDFYRRYDAYRQALAAWNAQYGPVVPPAAAPVAGPIAVPGAAPVIGSTMGGASAPAGVPSTLGPPVGSASVYGPSRN